MKFNLQTPTQIEGYDAYWFGIPVAKCPYDEDAEIGKWLEWKQGWCAGHLEAADAVKASV